MPSESVLFVRERRNGLRISSSTTGGAEGSPRARRVGDWPTARGRRYARAVVKADKTVLPFNKLVDQTSHPLKLGAPRRSSLPVFVRVWSQRSFAPRSAHHPSQFVP